MMRRATVRAIGVFLVLAGTVSACDKKDEAPHATPSVSATATASATTPSSAPSEATAAQKAPKEPPTQIAAQHVLVAYKGAEKCPKGITRTKADAKKRADEVAKRAKEKGADFSALVAELSDDPAAKERQGSLGKFGREKMAKAFSEAAFALDVDQTSEAVETPFGFHVIKRNQ